MAPPFSLCPVFLRREEKFTVVYLVRSFEVKLESVSHDWHVQPSCQRPNRGPPRRREFSPGGFYFMRANLLGKPTEQIRLSSKPYKHTCGGKSCQSRHPTGFPDVFHIGKFFGAGTGELPTESKSRFLTIKLFGMTNGLGGRSARAAVWPSVSESNATFRVAF